jgi:hypothetical protein
MDSPFSLREKVRMRGSNKAFSLFLFSSTLSAIAPALLYLLHPCSRPAGEGAFS